MHRAVVGVMTGSILALACAGTAFSQASRSQQSQQNAAMARMPSCAQPLGTLSIVNGDDPRGWNQNNLAPPEKLLRVIVQRSGCFNLVDRGAGLNAATRERDIGQGLGLQRGSNVGSGQVRAADYVMVAEVAAQDRDTGGRAIGGILGGLIGGKAGGVVAGIETHRLEAQTVLSVSSVRTTETIAVVEGHARRDDVSFGGGAGLGFLGAIGGGYDSTDIGRIVTMAFIDAYAKMVDQLRAYEGTVAAAEAPQRAFVATRPLNMRQAPDPAAPLVRNLEPGMTVYPTGKRQELWWEVADENDNVGWVLNTGLEPKN